MDARKLMVFLVFKLANRQNNGEVHESYRMAKIFAHSLHLYSQSELQDDNSTLHGISLSDIVDEVAALCCLFLRELQPAPPVSVKARRRKVC